MHRVEGFGHVLTRSTLSTVSAAPSGIFDLTNAFAQSIVSASAAHPSAPCLRRAPILFALVAGAFAIVPLRLRWNWRLVWHWSWSWPLLQIVFPPDAGHFGALVTLVRMLAAAEVVACLAILLTMRHEAVQAWFAARGKVAS